MKVIRKCKVGRAHHRQIIAEQMTAYLHGRLTLAQLVDWAEQAVMEAEFESIVTRDATARLGVADVRAFGLTWKDCLNILRDLGFAARVEVVA